MFHTLDTGRLLEVVGAGPCDEALAAYRAAAARSDAVHTDLSEPMNALRSLWPGTTIPFTSVHIEPGKGWQTPADERAAGRDVLAACRR